MWKNDRGEDDLFFFFENCEQRKAILVEEWMYEEIEGSETHVRGAIRGSNKMKSLRGGIPRVRQDVSAVKGLVKVCGKQRVVNKPCEDRKILCFFKPRQIILIWLSVS
jgi:hypothetical protein